MNGEFLQSPYFFAFFPPFILLIIGVLAKKLISKKAWNDWPLYFLGIESSTAALTSAIIYIGELAQQSHQQDWRRVLGIVGFTLISLVVFMLILTLHQHFEGQPFDKWHIIALAGVCNLLGSGLLLAFLFIKGVGIHQDASNSQSDISPTRKTPQTKPIHQQVETE
ncbi:hypothetical protein [Corallococcus sp. AB038B]|uniref:hypothetical protein n=1 Tax=Corallococcus sp. AB038B TaxID=2316718 RepID=UPI000EEE9773|nr:hypothetical protein [Corallococcus sp. AB038B]RKI01534.1 hypothetical protein D7Y04_13465 [Corallococcus sp. AB038B]